MIFKLAIPFIFGLLISACGQSDTVIVKTGNHQVHISNTSNETFYYVIYPARVMQYVKLVPMCTEQNALKPGETKSLSYEELLQTGTDDEAVIYWWRCDEGETQTTVGKAHVIRVSL